MYKYRFLLILLPLLGLFACSSRQQAPVPVAEPLVWSVTAEAEELDPDAVSGWSETVLCDPAARVVESEILPKPEDVPEVEPVDAVTEEGKPKPWGALAEQLVPFTVRETAPADGDYYENAVFLGDSVTLGLKLMTTRQRRKDSDFLKGAQFIAVGSYGVADAIAPVSDTSIHMLWHGVQTRPEEILADMGATKVFICLGLNDVGLYSTEKHFRHYETLIGRIREKNPDITIVILSTTPMTKNGERKVLNNARIDLYNSETVRFAVEQQCYYVDIASLLKDEDGYLRDDYASDDYVHLRDVAYLEIVHYLNTHTVGG